ncbi:hypothetical protein NQ314_006585 [Rhamnusium bicolor]|uniref:Uncharacterized protein n=1 Tax=Rhamnusium bicolor TaxID=1586634 RepID=A0AAV8Z1M8_9CUCU|nr:hypothetical protein NQ314_006585 [Rhamnusium bicolor]
MELERSIVQGTFLVIRKPQEDTFNICRLDQNIYLRENEQYKITWLKKTKNRNEYLIMSNGIIMSENILCEIKLKKISRFKYKLLHLGEKFIEREMKYALEEDGIDIRCTAFNRSNFTIDSILLGKPEETCIENGSGNVDFKEDSVSPNLQEKLFKRKVTTYNEDKENNCQPHIEKKKRTERIEVRKYIRGKMCRWRF